MNSKLGVFFLLLRSTAMRAFVPLTGTFNKFDDWRKLNTATTTTWLLNQANAENKKTTTTTTFVGFVKLAHVHTNWFLGARCSDLHRCGLTL